MKRFALALCIVAMLAVMAWAYGPPFVGWGLDPTDWISTGTPWVHNGGEMMYRPGSPDAGFYLVGPGGSLTLMDNSTWPHLTIDLYNEWELVYNIPETEVVIHVLSEWNYGTGPGGTGNPLDPELIFQLAPFTISSNECGVFQMYGFTGYSADNLKWADGVLNFAPYVHTGTLLDLDWWISYDGGAFNDWIGTSGIYSKNVGICDHTIQLKGRVNMPYHAAAGHYETELVLCPVPEP